MTTDPAPYARLYENGWRAAHRDGRSLESVKPAAWLDGFLDCATGREKWHRRDCAAANHDDCSEASR